MSGDRPLRADARRNRERLLTVADEVFAAKGVGTSTEEIARAAGVGIGTVFRHFPTKEALLGAVYLARLRRRADEATALATAADPGVAFFGFFRALVEQASPRTAIADALAEAGVDIKTETASAGHGFQAAFEVLLRRAQDQGTVRPDVVVADLIALLVGVVRAAEHAGTADSRGRTISIVLDGLRPRGNG